MTPPQRLTGDMVRVGDRRAADASGQFRCPPVGFIFSWNEFFLAVNLTTTNGATVPRPTAHKTARI